MEIDDRNLLTVFDQRYLTHGPKFPINTSDEDLGMWLLFLDRANVPAAWARAKQLYDADQLTGVQHMSVTTAFANGHDHDTKVIMCFCGPWRLRLLMEAIGDNLAEKMGLEQQRCSSTPFIYFKTVEQSRGEMSEVKYTYKVLRRGKILQQPQEEK